ncbi:MAG: ATP-binding protein [Candidatus Cloacimonetes bacterium]|nr:ATP-binding protein [Candidatus Cloacimonadota bacterium]
MQKKRAIIIYGARRTGKTTILKEISSNLNNVQFINCDLIDGQEGFNFRNQQDIKLSFSRFSYLLIDEAQRVSDIGIKLKAIIDTLPEIQIIATGSSSLDLSNFINEPLTGRKFEFILHPLSTEELYEYEGIDAVIAGLRHRLIFGNYPEVYLEKSMPVEIIKEIAGSYLFKDILVFQDIKRPDLLKKLLIALALQLGNEVSYTELGNNVGLDRKTVERYIHLLEQSFIIYRLGSYSKNLRNELKRGVKVYFWDNGIRNALINNFNPPDMRTDTGALWENYIITERRKQLLNKRANFDHYFWRTTSQQEIDLLEIKNSFLRGFEIKWNPQKAVRTPLAFTKAYPKATFQIINPKNYLEFLLENK